MLATAVDVAFDPVGDAPTTVYLLYVVSANLWGVGGMFFGLWLIPMGLCVLRSGWMPRPLGWLLIGGGVGYLLGAFIVYLAPEARVVAELIAVPAHIAEFWMVGYLLVRGIRRRTPQETPRDDARMDRTGPRRSARPRSADWSHAASCGMRDVDAPGLAGTRRVT